MEAQKVIVYVREEEVAQRQRVAGMVSAVLAEYPIYVLARVTEQQIAALREAGFRVDVQENAYQIELAPFSLDARNLPQKPPEAEAFEFAFGIPERPAYYLLLFVGSPKEEWRRELAEMGIELLEPVPTFAYLAKIPEGAEERVRALPYIEWVGPYLPEYKLKSLLRGGGQRGPAGPTDLSMQVRADAAPFNPQGNLEILLHQGETGEDAAERVRSLGGQVVMQHPPHMVIALEPTQIPALAALPSVKVIGLYSPPGISNNVGAVLTNTAPVLVSVGLDGTGEIGAVMDTGLDSGSDPAVGSAMHPDFRGRVAGIVGHPNPPGITRDADGHGTHTAGSMLGNGTASGGQVRGMAPGARLFFQAIAQGTFSPNTSLPGLNFGLINLFQQAYNAGARVHSNSWGSGPPSIVVPPNPTPVKGDITQRGILGDYTAASRDVDTFMNNNKDMLIVFSAGNEGVDLAAPNGRVDPASVTPPATAKNCVTVGASESLRTGAGGGLQVNWSGSMFAENPALSKFPSAPINGDRLSNNPHGLAGFSSRGLTDNNRVKPDVVAPGTNILSCRSQQPTVGNGWAAAANPMYRFEGGTSMAAPQVAGIALVLRQFYRTRQGNANPSAALIKATIINAATPLTGQYLPVELGPAAAPGSTPNLEEGWGIVNLHEVVQPVPPRRLWFRDEWQNPANSLNAGNDFIQRLRVTDRTESLKITLVWTDPPDATLVGRLVNDLDLEVTTPDGTRLAGNAGLYPAGSPCLANVDGLDRDICNNVETLLIEMPPLGEYQVRVVARTILQGPQDYALVVTGAFDVI